MLLWSQIGYYIKNNKYKTKIALKPKILQHFVKRISDWIPGWTPGKTKCDWTNFNLIYLFKHFLNIFLSIFLDSTPPVRKGRWYPGWYFLGTSKYTLCACQFFVGTFSAFHTKSVADPALGHCITAFTKGLYEAHRQKYKGAIKDKRIYLRF